MITQQAIIVDIDDDTVWLEVERQSTCSQCQVRQGCGTGLLSKHVGNRFSRISVKKTNDVTIGQHVQLAIPEQHLLHATVLIYIVPLICMFLLASVTQVLNINELAEIFSGIAGLLIGLYWVRRYLRNKKDDFNVRIIEE